MGGVIPPVGLNLFAVSGTTGVPVTKVMKGAIPFLITDGIVLISDAVLPDPLPVAAAATGPIAL